ncbi:hypothetical protein AMAG_04976 [Allomyces macrogynus ATCC 38327]|uniref:Uncharacterized protein n=1 Tax=Allomyces macrogynus (strain ATCC 38327) TaxID=578462 RepID=A0A0L0S6Z2_ALLM3|nr:hypothetical protein AMAG_04976 [Allomyces macrogynus ATCC 38327]|eukprot:KNE58161.1 hypothetical protein AMAG_04976 [Allomyces macrogynus ATCC 38327]
MSDSDLVLRFLRSLAGMEEAAAFRIPLAHELALHYVSRGDLHGAYSYLDPLTSQYPYSDDEPLIGLLAMVSIALLDEAEADRAATQAENGDDDRDEDASDSDDDALMASQRRWSQASRTSQRSSSRLSQSFAGETVSYRPAQYLGTARRVLDRLRVLYPQSMRFLAHHAYLLAVAGLRDAIPDLLEQALADIPTVTGPTETKLLSLSSSAKSAPTAPVWNDAARAAACRGIIQVAKVYGIAIDAGTGDDALDSSAFGLDATAADMQRLDVLMADLDFPCTSVPTWAELVDLLGRFGDDAVIRAFPSSRRSWWFSLHLVQVDSDPVELVVFKCLVALLVIPDVYHVAKARIWAHRGFPDALEHVVEKFGVALRDLLPASRFDDASGSDSSDDDEDHDRDEDEDEGDAPLWPAKRSRRSLSPVKALAPAPASGAPRLSPRTVSLRSWPVSPRSPLVLARPRSPTTLQRPPVVSPSSSPSSFSPSSLAPPPLSRVLPSRSPPPNRRSTRLRQQQQSSPPVRALPPPPGFATGHDATASPTSSPPRLDLSPSRAPANDVDDNMDVDPVVSSEHVLEVADHGGDSFSQEFEMSSQPY